MTAVDDEGNEGDLSDPDSATTDAEPVDTSYDGTGTEPTPQSESFVDGLFEIMTDLIEIYWTGWWPMLNLVINYEPIPEVTLNFHIGIDLIGSFTVFPETALNLIQPLIVKYAAGTQNPATVFAKSLEVAFQYLLGVGDFPFFAASLIAATTMKITSYWVETGPAGVAAFALSCIAFLGLILWGAYIAVMGAMELTYHPWAIALTLVIWVFTLLGIPGGSYLYDAASINDKVNIQRVNGELTKEAEVNSMRAVAVKYSVGWIFLFTGFGLIATAIGLMIWASLNGIDTTYNIEED